MIPVVQQRKTLLKELRSALSEEYVIVSNPDHPLVLRSPDLLVGGNGHLIAIFVPTSVERNSLRNLRDRLILNLLALPAHTQFVLVLDRDAGWMSDEFAQDFSDIVDLDKATTLAHRLVRSSAGNGKEEKIRETQRLSRILYSQALDISHDMVRRWRRDRLAHQEVWQDDVVLGLVEQGAESRLRATHRSASNFVAEFPEIPFWAFTEGKIDSTALVAPIYQQVDRLYRLDSGVPHCVEEQLGVLVVHTFPTTKQDPEKPLRAAALAGWSTVRWDQSEQISEVAKKLREFRRSDQ